MDFNYEKALTYILTIATKRGLSQAQLCDGICDPSNFSKICSGKRVISGDLIIKLAQKLSLSLEDISLYANSINTLEYLNVLKQFKQLYTNEDFRAIKKLYDTHYNDSIHYSPQEEQLFLWMKSIFELYLYFNPLYAIDLCKKAISTTNPYFSLQQLNTEVLSELELDILLTIVMCYLAQEELTATKTEYTFDTPLAIVQSVLEDLSTRSILKDLKLYPKYCEILALIYSVPANKEDLYLTIQQGLDYCKENHEFSLIPTFYMHLCTYERLNNRPEHAIQLFYECLYLYKLQNKPPCFYRNLPHFIQNQNLQVDLEKVNQLLPKPSLTTKYSV